MGEEKKNSGSGCGCLCVGFFLDGLKMIYLWATDRLDGDVWRNNFLMIGGFLLLFLLVKFYGMVQEYRHWDDPDPEEQDSDASESEEKADKADGAEKDKE